MVGTHRMYGGVVLCTNYMTLDQETLGFWNSLHQSLQGHGLTLCMASTTAVTGASFPVLDIPYHLAGFADWDTGPAAPVSGMHEVIASSVAADRGIPIARATQGAASTFAFYADLLAATRPSAFLVWNAMHSHSQVAMAASRLAGVPCWGAERGWVRDTMMFDLGENSALAEWGLSMSLHSLLREAEADTHTFERIRRHHLSRPVGRYGHVPFQDAAHTREELGIAADAPIWSAFPHGGPGIDAGPMRAGLHATSPARLDAALAEAAQCAAESGAVLLVQEHPINAILGIERPRAIAAGARFVTSNIHNLLAASDLTLHSGSTVQFDALYYRRPLVLLNRSIMSLARVGDRRGAFEVGVDGTVRECLRHAATDTAWQERQTNLERLASVIARHQLIDVGFDLVPNRPADFAEVLSRHAHNGMDGLDVRLAQFLAQWRGSQ